MNRIFRGRVPYNLLRKRGLSASLEERICSSYDATGMTFLPDFVSFPSNAGEIIELIKNALDRRIPIVPRGAGTGLSGGALPVEGGIVIETSHLNSILDIDDKNFVAIVEPGVITGDLQGEVEKLGLFYPPDPLSLKFCTIGGNVGESAGGPRAIKYGVTRDYVLGLDTVLSSGELLKTGAKTMKGVVGYDLTRLLVGSEGTLGIFTRIILRLIPLPETKNSIVAFFPSSEDAINAAIEILFSKIVPAILEFMDDEAIRAVSDYVTLEIPDNSRILLIIEVDGEHETVLKGARRIEEICEKNRAIKLVVADNRVGEEEIWMAREALSPAMAKIKPHKVNHDIVVPKSAIPAILTRIGEIREKYELNIINFGHLGDGNIHVNILLDKENKEELVRSKDAERDLFISVLEMEGTISGEYGVGITKMPYLEKEIGKIGIEMMKKIKHAFDPYSIMNPGKIF